MASVHYISVKFTKKGKMGNLPCNFTGHETFYFDSDSDALRFADIAVQEGCTITASGCHHAWSVQAAQAKLQVFKEGVDRVA